MKKTEEMNEYLDWYGELLTEKQQDICDLYFKEDFSLSEISENYDISRAAVLDTIKRSKKLLEDYEKNKDKLSTAHILQEITENIPKGFLSAKQMLPTSPAALQISTYL